MEIHLTPPTSHKGEIIFEEQEIRIFAKLLDKLGPEVERNSSSLGYRDTKRIKANEKEFFYELADRIHAVASYIEEQKNINDDN